LSCTAIAAMFLSGKLLATWTPDLSIKRVYPKVPGR
jgi:hypothetical protein